MTSSRWRFVTMVSVLVLCVALIVTTARLRSSENATDALREALAAEKEASKRDRHTLAELCRTHSILHGLVAETIDLRRRSLAQGDVPLELRARWRLSITIFEGYLEQIDQQTACKEVVRP